MALATTSEARVSSSVGAYARGSQQLADSNYRISSGNRIIRNGDDASSISAASFLQSQTNTLRSTLQNGAKASSFLQIAYDGLDQIRSILETLNDLTATANEHGTTTRQFKLLDAQFQSSKSQIDGIVATTTFNNSSILDGSAASTGAPVIITGDASGDTVSLAIPSVTSASLFSGAVSIGTAVTAAAATTPVSNAKQLVEDALAKVNAYQLRLDTADAATRNRIYGIDLATDNLLNTDIAAETNKADRQELTQQIAAAVIAQTLGLNSNLLQLLQR